MAEVLTPKSEVEQPVLPEVLVAVPVPPSAALTKARKVILVVAPILAVVMSWGSAVGLHYMMTNGAPTTTVADRGPVNGAKLFSQHCAQCHGERGDGNGVSPLEPRARHFGAEKFKFGTTTNAVGRVVPTDDDLLRILRHGIPGSAMPAFTQLTEEEQRAIIGQVRLLTWENLYAQLRDKSIKDEGDFDPLDVAQRTVAMTQPGKPLEVPAKFADSNAEVLAHGRKVYMQSCAPCHGQEGRGDGQQVKDPNFKNENGTPARPRDLTQGLYKGGGNAAEIYARIVLGIPGTPMPATNNLPPQDIDALVAYVCSLPGH